MSSKFVPEYIEYYISSNIDSRGRLHSKTVSYPDAVKQWVEESGLTLRQAKWLMEHADVESIPVCPVCGSPVHFENGSKWCSAKCSNKDASKKEKIKQVCLEKYGDTSYTRTKECKEKTRQTCLKKYGVESYSKLPEFTEKMKKSCMERYGVENYSQTQEYHDRIKQTCLEKYGVESHSQLDSFKEHISKIQRSKTSEERALILERHKKTCLEKYGVENYSQTQKSKEHMSELWKNRSEEEIDAIQQKMAATSMERYGVDNYSKTDACKKRVKKTELEKYGGHHAGNAEVQKKQQQTCLERYGSVSYSSSEEGRKRISEIKNARTPEEIQHSNELARKTCIERYNAPCYSLTQEYLDKCRQTSIEHFGEDHWTKTEEGKLEIRKHKRAKNFESKIKLLEDKKHLVLLSDYEEYLSADLVRYKCLRCGEEVLSPGTNIQTVVCPNCCRSGTSMMEKDVCHYVHSIYSGTVIENTRSVIAPKELDIYIPDKNLAIEFNGAYWHSSAQKPKDYHLQKTLACREKGIRLIHIFEWEWMNNESVCKALIRSALGLNSRCIGARKCDIFEISSETYRMFLEEFHLQGAVNSPMRLGLFHDGELLAVAGWGKSRFRKGEMELHRFCIKADVSIPGALSRLCSHSGLESFISYVDLSHFNGTGYVKAGFKEIGISSPGYCWCRGPEILSRLQTQKHKLPELLGEDFDPELTEAENMELAGWMQSFDCGNLKMEWQKN